jgi:hypothetical protein
MECHEKSKKTGKNPRENLEGKEGNSLTGHDPEKSKMHARLHLEIRRWVRAFPRARVFIRCRVFQ